MKKTLALALALIMLLTLCACGAPAETAPKTDAGSGEAGEAAEPVTIRVGTLNQQLSIPLYYIQQQGWDVENGFKLEISTFAQGSGINEALGSGLVDVFTIGAAAVNSCCVYDAVFLYSHENSGAGQQFMIRADSELAKTKGELADYPEVYGTAEAIKGTTFLLPMGTTAQILADVYLQAFGLTEDDVTLVNMSDDATVYQAFVSGEGDFGKTSYPTADSYNEEYLVACSMESMDIPFYDNILCSRAMFEDESKHEALVSLVVQMIRAAEAFQDEQVLIDTMLGWYETCGVTVDAEAIEHQVLERPFFTYDELSSIDVTSSFKLIAEFYEQVGIITSEDLEVVMNNIDSTIIAEALTAYADLYK